MRRIKPKADTRYLLLVAEYRQMIGSSWYLEYEVPYKEQHEDAVCTAMHRKRPPLPDPCFYVLLERYETRGGASPSLASLKAGHKIRGKMIRCAPPAHQYVIDPKIASNQKRWGMSWWAEVSWVMLAPRFSDGSNAAPSVPQLDQ